MQKRFGFVASETLIQMILDANDALENGGSEPMYVYRNKLIQQVSDELIKNMVLDLADEISNPKRQEAIKKLGGTLQNVVGKIVKVMLAKDKDKIVLQSKPFLESSVARDADGKVRMGFEVSAELYNKIQETFNAVHEGNISTELRQSVKELLKKIDDVLLQHFIVDFVRTLGWGSIKMNLAKGTKATITKADSVMVEKMVDSLSLKDLQELLPHFQSKFFESNIIGLDVLATQ